ncbi:hypothetical protein GYMLUDRAFT_93816 [Collybiopsis luxurians FD-317 M1]|nr:hypothetical protein GYMLUDRAFT_93816 [Collybiopsis luxurians FD-317 M1]
MDEETLVTRRSKRSTAGNRMQAALAEIAVEDLSREDLEEDKDFIVETYEEDAFESDFASTDEEEAAAEEQEATAQVEEKQARKAARSRLERATAAAHARQKTTFNPTATAETPSTSASTKSKPKRRVSLGFALNAQTGQLIPESDNIDRGAEGNGVNEGTDAVALRKRSSKRQTTIQNTTDTVKRYLISESKKAAQPRKKIKTRHKYTQAELLARALDTEEGNLVDHRDYLRLEEEKRELRAKRDKIKVCGPLLRFISRVEEEKTEVIEEVEEEEEKEEEEKEHSPAGYTYNPYISYGQSTTQPNLASTIATAVPHPTPAPVGSTSAGPTSSPFLNLALSTPISSSSSSSPSTVPPSSSTSTGAPFLQLAPSSSTHTFSSSSKPALPSLISTSNTPAPPSAAVPFLWLAPTPPPASASSSYISPWNSIPSTTTTAPTSTSSTIPSTSAGGDTRPFLKLAPSPPPVQTPPPPTSLSSSFHTFPSLPTKNLSTSKSASTSGSKFKTSGSGSTSTSAPFLWLAPTPPPAAPASSAPSYSMYSQYTQTQTQVPSNNTSGISSTSSSSLYSYPGTTFAPTLTLAPPEPQSLSQPQPQKKIKTKTKTVIKSTTEKVSKSYLVHELYHSDDDEEDTSQVQGSANSNAKGNDSRAKEPLKPGTKARPRTRQMVDAEKPDWESTMQAVFGDHVEWGKVRVLVSGAGGKGSLKIEGRYIPTCAITGQPAKYFDPRTGVPYANVLAFRILRRFAKGLGLGLGDETGTGTGAGARTRASDLNSKRSSASDFDLRNGGGGGGGDGGGSGDGMEIDAREGKGKGKGKDNGHGGIHERTQEQEIYGDDDEEDDGEFGLSVWDDELGCYVGDFVGNFGLLSGEDGDEDDEDEYEDGDVRMVETVDEKGRMIVDLT